MIVYKTGRGNGGFGDRIVGLVSCIYLSRVLNDDIFIDWSSPDIKDFIEYNSINSNNYKSFRLIDRLESLEFIKKVNLESFKNTSIQSNLNFIDNIFINQGRDRNEYLDEVLDIYSKLFKEYLKPKKVLNDYINNNVSKFKGKTIGIQIRMGDVYMGVGNHKNFEIESIKKSISLIPKDFDSIFLTTDNNQVVDIVFNEFKDKNIIYDNTKISHIDRMNTGSNEMLKVLSDIITLSKTDFRYITVSSNFGRIANLISDNPYDFRKISNLESVDLIKLTKKGNRLFK